VNGPNGARGVAGVFGVASSQLVDIDECSIELDHCERRFGLAPIGERASMPGFPSRHGIRLNLLLAIDVNQGPVAFWIYPGTTDADLFAFFIGEMLLPRLGGNPRVVMWDNVSFHFTNNTAINLLTNGGHTVVARPPYSPDMAPIESAFSKIKISLRKHIDYISPVNLELAICLAVQSITALNAQGWFQNCHYYIPGREYRPYLGPNPGPFL